MPSACSRRGWVADQSAPHVARLFHASLSAARCGEDAVVGELLEACRPYLLTIAQGELPGELRGKLGASDLVQETLTRAVEHFREFRGEHQDELAGWLRRILINHLANVRRGFASRKRATGLELSDHADLALIVDQSPSSIVAQRDEEQRLEEALRRLPDHYQRVIRLRHQENRTFPAIAEALGKSQGAVEKIWTRAIVRLQAELDL